MLSMGPPRFCFFLIIIYKYWLCYLCSFSRIVRYSRPVPGETRICDEASSEWLEISSWFCSVILQLPTRIMLQSHEMTDRQGEPKTDLKSVCLSVSLTVDRLNIWHLNNFFSTYFWAKLKCLPLYNWWFDGWPNLWLE